MAEHLGEDSSVHTAKHSQYKPAAGFASTRSLAEAAALSHQS